MLSTRPGPSTAVRGPRLRGFFVAADQFGRLELGLRSPLFDTDVNPYVIVFPTWVVRVKTFLPP
jgi:hypothetical protein